MKTLIQISMIVAMIAGLSAPVFAGDSLPCNAPSDSKSKELPAQNTGTAKTDSTATNAGDATAPSTDKK